MINVFRNDNSNHFAYVNTTKIGLSRLRPEGLEGQHRRLRELEFFLGGMRVRKKVFGGTEVICCSFYSCKHAPRLLGFCSMKLFVRYVRKLSLSLG